MKKFMNITKALSSETRVRILLLLGQSELCLCQLIELLQLSAATISKHLSLLSLAGLVDTRKEGRWHYYRLSEKPEMEVAAALEFIDKVLSNSPSVKKNQVQVKKVLKMDKEELCRHYKAMPTPFPTGKSQYR